MATVSLRQVRQSRNQSRITRFIANGQPRSCVTSCTKLAGVLLIFWRKFCSDNASRYPACEPRGQRRPSFIAAAPSEEAKKLYEEFSEALHGLGVTVATGVFQAMMSVELVNEGPVTILLDSDKTF